MSNDNEGFVRWQQRTIEERGRTITLFLGMSFATVGFVINQLISKDFSFTNSSDKFFISTGMVALFVSIVLLIWLVLNRLRGFRETADIARAREAAPTNTEWIEELRSKANRTDERTLYLFKSSLWIFAIAELLIVIGFVIHLQSKF